MDIDIDRIGRSNFVVGAVGALITAMKFTPGASLPERITTVLAGSSMAGYLTPALVQWLGMPSAGYASAAAFLIGLLGMSLAAAALAAIKETPLGQILAGWLGRKGG